MGELDADGLEEALAGRSELEVLLEQLDELLGEGVTTGEDALEVATVAGLAVRLGAPPESLKDARDWLEGGGLELVEAGLQDTDLDELVEVLGNLDQADEHEVEEEIVSLGEEGWLCGSATARRSETRRGRLQRSSGRSRIPSPSWGPPGHSWRGRASLQRTSMCTTTGWLSQRPDNGRTNPERSAIICPLGTARKSRNGEEVVQSCNLDPDLRALREG